MAQSNDKFYKKLEQDTSTIRDISSYLINNNFHKEFKQEIIWVKIEDLKDKTIIKKCKELSIKEISIQGDKGIDYHRGVVPYQNVIIFELNKLPALSPHQVIIVDYSENNKVYPNINRSELKVKTIGENIYYLIW